MSLYPFQERVYDRLSSGRSVILQAPTGAGKTRAALYPFLRAWEHREDFPRKCIYSVPLRVLANQFWQEYEQRARNFGFLRPLDVCVQTGARPDDPKLEGGLIFTTADQTLSNLLNIPYALSLSQGNLNAGAVLSSYLVFDELHLFDPDVMLPTTLHLLRMLRGVVPFLVMTATFSKEMVQALAKALDAEPLVLSPQEAAEIPSQHKTRRVHAVEQELTASAILEKHQQRSVAICNTVARAQGLYEALREQSEVNTKVRLLHSRFLPQHRKAAEDWLQREFGKDRDAHCVQSAILVATQVIEVGLDITCQALHTELAPAASVIQRAGRCARYRDQVGDVYVYRLPLNRHGKPDYAPYFCGQKEICAKTWDALSERTGDVFDFGAELAIVNAAHKEADQQMLDRLRATRHYVADRIAETIEAQDRGAARELIRDVDSRTVIVHPDPPAIEHPWAYEGFGLYKGTLFGAYKRVEHLADQLDVDWIMMTADPLPEDETSRGPTVWRWRHIVGQKDLTGALLVAVHPRLARYSAETGFQLGVEGDPAWQSPPRERKGKQKVFPPYQRETFQEHVARMLGAYHQPFYDQQEDRHCLPLKEELAYAARRLEHKHGWAEGTIDRLARLAIVLHDVGKLDRRWQAWAHRWQEKVSALRREELAIPDGYMAAHTDYDSQDEREEALNWRLGGQRPNHAVESAAAGMELFLAQAGDPALARAALTAVARHHSAGAGRTHGAFAGHPSASEALLEALDEAGLASIDPSGVGWSLAEGSLARRVIRPRRPAELLPYLFLVRVLRLADQRSQAR